MSKHIADHKRESSPSRTRNFTRQERESAMHPAVAFLRARPRSRADMTNRRMAEFARIERGHMA